MMLQIVVDDCERLLKYNRYAIEAAFPEFHEAYIKHKPEDRISLTNESRIAALKMAIELCNKQK